MAQDTDFRSELVAIIPNLRAFAASLAGSFDRADDLVQETLVKAWDKQHTFQPGTNLKAWLFTTCATSSTRRCARRAARCKDVDGIHAMQLAGHPEQQGHLDLQDFRKALDQLPDDQREALILIGASGFSYEERPKSANAPSARSRAACRAPVPRWPTSSGSKATASSARLDLLPDHRRRPSRLRRNPVAGKRISKIGTGVALPQR